MVERGATNLKDRSGDIHAQIALVNHIIRAIQEDLAAELPALRAAPAVRELPPLMEQVGSNSSDWVALPPWNNHFCELQILVSNY